MIYGKHCAKFRTVRREDGIPAYIVQQDMRLGTTFCIFKYLMIVDISKK